MASPTETNAQGSSNNADSTTASIDPFASQRKNSVGQYDGVKTASPIATSPTKDASSPVQDRRLSTDEWDAGKTPPSRFQKRKGSVYATQGSRDSHVDSHKERDSKFHEVVATMTGGVVFGGRRKSSSKGSDVEKKDGGKVEENK